MDERRKNAGVTAEVAGVTDLSSYMHSVIEQLESDKKRPAVHTYTYTLKSITEFYGGEGTLMPVDEVFTPGKLKEYEEWMKQEGMRKKGETPKGLSLNTISTYMRSLKAVYHRLACEKLLPYNVKLFDDVYTKVESQTKRALEKEQMNTLMDADFEKLPQDVRCALAYFLLMFLFRGMPFIDLAYLRKQDVIGNYIVYSRHKTGRQMTIRIPREAAQLIEEFRNKSTDSIYLFPILDGKGKGRNGQMKKDKELYLSYLQALRHFNKKLEKVAALLLPGAKLSSYTPRHTWATLAFHTGVNIGIICKALGHSSIKVTETYLKPFENEKVDAANDELIFSVAEGNGKKKAA
ncbi:tyrosine-type recombinase/integrase [Bacteroides sp.]|uniref:tyrosine-type recombinase/integrase n=1 Tax=Bacteroides sp. TaxID=29523 RepID=UPI003AB6B895